MNEHPPKAGAWRNEDATVTFTVWAPLKKNVTLILDGSDRRHILTSDDLGYWSVTLPDITRDTPYWYQLDGGKNIPDPASRQQPDVHGPSITVDGFFQWTDSEWRGIELKQMIQYELHVGTFTSAGTFAGVISKLPYLKNLGINTIELMPIAQFPGNRNWGYDGVYPFAVQDSYGGSEELKRLVDTAHASGIAVILDVVYNHLGPEGNYFNEYGPYFTDKYKTGWGNAINFDDAWSDGVRNFYWQNALMWLDEFHIDGLRLDAVHAIWDFGAKHFFHELKNKVQALETKTGRKKILIAEFDLNNPRYINPQTKGGYGLDGQWIDEFHHALHSLTTGEVDGYYEDFGELSHLVKTLKDSYVYTGQYSKHRKKYFGILPEENPYHQFIVFSQNHDQIGNRLLGDRLTSTLSGEMLKLVAATVLLSPHVPMLFMGEEYGEKNPFQYFISHGDKELIELVRAGRKKEFSYFQWKEEIPDPQNENTFEQCKLSWSVENSEEKNALFKFYKYLIAFRKERLAMQGTARHSLRIISQINPEVLCFERTFNGDTIHIYLNFGKQKASVALAVSKATKIFDSADKEWGGPGESILADQTIALQSESIVILELK